MLCIFGAFIGLVSLFIAWIPGPVTRFITRTGSYLGIGGSPDLITILRMVDSLGTHGLDGATIQIACILVMGGTLIAFLSPSGAFLQLSGVAIFLEWFLSEAEEGAPGVGAYMTVISAVIVFISLVKPIGIGYGPGPTDLKGHLLTISGRTTGRLAMLTRLRMVLAQSTWRTTFIGGGLVTAVSFGLFYWTSETRIVDPSVRALLLIIAIIGLMAVVYGLVSRHSGEGPKTRAD